MAKTRFERQAIWPSKVFVEQIKSRIPCKAVIYKHAGHGILAAFNGPIYHPVGEFWCSLGGTPEANRAANEKSWQEIVDGLPAPPR